MIAAVVLACLVLTAGVSGLFGIAGAVTLAASSVAWLVVNSPMEGPVLIVLSRGHGLTGADLAGVTGLGLAAFHGVRAQRSRRSV